MQQLQQAEGDTVSTSRGRCNGFNKPKAILFISRAYPPVIGGIENQNYEIGKALSDITKVKIIANKKGRKFLPFFAPYALIKSLFLFRKYDVVLLGDGALAILGWFLKLFYKKPVVSIAHGLDLNYDSASLKVPGEKLLIKIYQKLWVGFFIPKLDKLIAVGNETIRQGIKVGIPAEKFVFVPNGVDPEKLVGNYTKKDLEKVTGLKLSDKKVLLTLGRLAKRKGVAWFVKNVMPKLDNSIIYLIAGNGVDKNNIKKAITENNLQKRVKLLDKISEKERKILFNTADIFVQPNIKVKGDMEGFGLVVLEAASCNRTVVASRLEGLQDAIQDGKNGFLVESENAEQWAKKITAILEADDFRQTFGKRARQYTVENFSWNIIAKKYLEVLEKL